MAEIPAWALDKQKDIIDVLSTSDPAGCNCIARALVAEREREARIADDLLEALKMAQMWLEWDGRYDMQGINAAIRKATGDA